MFTSGALVALSGDSSGDETTASSGDDMTALSGDEATASFGDKATASSGEEMEAFSGEELTILLSEKISSTSRNDWKGAKRRRFVAALTELVRGGLAETISELAVCSSGDMPVDMYDQQQDRILTYLLEWTAAFAAVVCGLLVTVLMARGVRCSNFCFSAVGGIGLLTASRTPGGPFLDRPSDHCAWKCAPARMVRFELAAKVVSGDNKFGP